MRISNIPACTSNRTFLILATTALMLCGRPAVAQRTAAPVDGTKIAVIDVKYILENHKRFEQAMKGLRTQFEAAGGQLKTDQQRIVSLQKKMQELNPGSPDYNAIDEKIAREKSEWSIKANKHRKEIQRQEAQILWNVYYEIKTETKRYCEKNGIGLVISFNGEQLDSKNPQDVVKGISRPIIYHASQLDITPWVLGNLNKPGGRPFVPTADTRNGAPKQVVPGRAPAQR